MEEEGFLASSLHKFKEISTKYPKHYDAALDVNRYAQQLQYKIEIQKNYDAKGVEFNTNQLLSAILFSRTVSTYQAFLLISQRGMAQQAKMLLRCMLESLFQLVAIQKNKNYSQSLIAAEECERLKALNKIIRHKTRLNPDDLLIEEVQSLADASKKKIIKNQLKKIGIEDNAKAAGLQDWYDTAYAFLSGTVHSSIRSLQEALVLDDENHIICLKNEPEIDGFCHLYATAIEAILFGVIAIGDIFKLNVDEFASKTYLIIRDLILEDG